MKDKIFKNLPLIIFLLVFILPSLGKTGFILLLAVIFAFLFIKNTKNSLLNNLKSPFGTKDKNMSETIDINSLNSLKQMKKMTFSVIGVLLLVWLFFASIVVIDAGETGVYSLFGKVRDNELKSGFHLVIPLAKITKMSIRTEEYTMSVTRGEGKRVGADAITSLTKEGLSVDLDMTVLFKIKEEKASDIYRTVGVRKDIDEKIIRPSIRTSIRDIIAQYEAKDIYSEKRQEAAEKIREALSFELEERGIIIEEVLLRNVALPQTLSAAIQEKLQAEQEAQKYDFILQKESKEKERKIIEAEGQRDAQKIINESLSTNYLYYLYINSLKDREGTVYVPTGTNSGMPLFRDLGR